MAFSRILTAALLAATPAMAATGPFTAGAGTLPPGTILVASGACAPQDVVAQAALAAQAGRAVGVVAQASACAGADAVMALEAAPALAFADDAQALGPRGEPNGFLARNREDGIYVWNMDAYRRLNLPPARSVLGVFEGETAGALVQAAIDRLSRAPNGYFLLIQADALEPAALDALARARAQGAAVLTPNLLVEASAAD